MLAMIEEITAVTSAIRLKIFITATAASIHLI